MRRIIVVVPDMVMGGVSTSVINFCNELSQRGNQVTFLNMGERNGLLERKIGKDILQIRLTGIEKYWNVSGKQISRSRLLLGFKYMAIGLVKKVLNKKGMWNQFIFHWTQLQEEYDVAIAFRQCAPCYHFVLNCVNAKKKICFLHGNLLTMGDVSSFDSYFQEYDQIACVSQACCDGFIDRYPQIKEKFHCVYNMFDASAIRQLANAEPIIPMNQKDSTIVTVSRLENATKGTNRIPQIAYLLKQWGLDFHWYIVGDGPDRKEIEEGIARAQLDDVITMCGALENPHCIVKKALVSVLPTYGEAYSMTIIESLILGIPVVATEYPGVEEAIVQGYNGYYTEQSVERIAGAIYEHMQNGDFYQIKQHLSRTQHNNDLAYKQLLELMV